MTKAGKPHRGVYHAYVRVSTEKQDLDRQQHIIKKYLNGGDYTLKWYIDEGFSGSLDPEERPALKQFIIIYQQIAVQFHLQQPMLLERVLHLPPLDHMILILIVLLLIVVLEMFQLS